MIDGTFGLGTMQGERIQTKGVVGVVCSVRVTVVFSGRDGPRDRIWAVP